LTNQTGESLTIDEITQLMIEIGEKEASCLKPIGFSLLQLGVGMNGSLTGHMPVVVLP
jgi:hypothetical protein